MDLFTGTFPLASYNTYRALYRSVPLGGLGLRKPKTDKPSQLVSARPIACTYAIENTATGMAYVGSTDDFFSRWYKHLNHIGNENHSCDELLAQVAQFGVDAFVIKILQHYPDQEAVLRACEKHDGLKHYGLANLMNTRLGDEWFERYPGRGLGKVYPRAKSAAARPPSSARQALAH